MKTMVVGANLSELPPELRTGYAEVSIPFCQRAPEFEITIAGTINEAFIP